MLQIEGMPSGVAARVSLSGPGGVRQVPTSGTINGLAAGAYTLAAAEVNAGPAIYRPNPASQVVRIDSGKTTTAVPVVYTLATGALEVTVGGLPTGASAAVTVSGPGGFSRTITQSARLDGLAPGTYVVSSQRTLAGGYGYDAIVSTLTVDVVAVPTPSTVSVTYQIATGGLSIAILGLPSGASGTIHLTGPAGYDSTVTGPALLTNLTPGSYRIAANPVVVGPDTWTAAPAVVLVEATSSPSTVSASYTIATGRLALAATGLPDGGAVQFQVSGPDGLSQAVTPGNTLTGLSPGTYTVTAPPYTAGTATWSATPSVQQAEVTASATPSVLTFAYGVQSAALQVIVTGLPQGVTGMVSVTGPDGFNALLTTTTTLRNLTPGNYAITPQPVSSGVHIYGPATPGTINVALGPGLAPVPVPVLYQLSSGLIALGVSGLPAGTSAAVTITGPNGYRRDATETTLVTGLTPGPYQVAASPVSDGGTWVPAPVTQLINVPASTTATPANVTYSLQTGTLSVDITGLPPGVPAAVTVEGPGGYSVLLSASQVLPVGTGNYVITAAGVVSGAQTYAPLPLTQQVTVTAGGSVSAPVNYSATAPGGPNLRIASAYITQSVQTWGNTVPLVSGRTGLLRVFVTASQTNSLQPTVRVRFYNGSTLVNTVTIPAPGTSVPTSADEGTLNSSWNTTLSGALLTPGLRMLIDVDPNDSVSEPDESDNTWPASGTPAPLNVRSLTPIRITLVPIMQSDSAGDVNDDNLDTFTDQLLRMMPTPSVDVSLHDTVTTTAPPLTSGGANWSTVLSEIYALRIADGSSRNYYGVVKVGYSSGVAGLGYIGAPAAIGWDYLPSGADILAHELGHNFNRLHAPCGGPSGPDPSYPADTAHAGGRIGAYGYDIFAGTLRPPTQYDLMSYCDPDWISDYNYSAILTWREANPSIVSPRIVAGGSRRGLLIWGRIVDGVPILEPAFEIDAPASMPARTGPNRIEAFDAAGQSLFALSFDGERIADIPGDSRAFAFVVPMTVLRGRTLDRLTLSRGGRKSEMRAASGSAAQAPATFASVSGKRVRVSWGPTTRAALIRNARTGEVLSIARGRSVNVIAGADPLEVILSDGVKSRR